jgi:hypothetical protein
MMDLGGQEIHLWSANILAPLRQEAQGYVNNLRQKHFDRLNALGVSAARIIATGIVGVAQIEVLAGDLWQPCEGGDEYLTVGVSEDDGIVDILAFRPSDPDVWYLRRGSAWALGHDAIMEARGAWCDQESAIALTATPLDWLRGDMAGACIIDWTQDAVMTLRDAVRIQVPSREFARALRLQLSRPPALPPIDVKRGARRAA